MDNKGHWHNVPLPTPEELAMERSGEGAKRPRYVAHMDIGERVEIVKADGTRIAAQFWEAKGNKVVLRTLPVGG
jgi:hypothetical protein